MRDRKHAPSPPLGYATPGPCYRLRRPAGAGCGGVLAAAFAVALASMPWVMLIRRGTQPELLSELFTATWSTLLLVAATGVLYWSLCRVEMHGAAGRVRRRSRWLLLEFVRAFEFDRAYLARVWRSPKGGGVRDVLLVRTPQGKRCLADANACADLPALLRWVGETAGVKTLDARAREPLCSPRRQRFVPRRPVHIPSDDR